MAFISRLFGRNTAGETPAVETQTNNSTTAATGPTTPAVETQTTTAPVVTPTAVETATTVNAVAANPIEQAKLQLTGKGQTKVDALYERTVTNVDGTFKKAINWIRFHFGKLSKKSCYGEAKAQDKEIKAAAKDFNDATTKLIAAAYKKNLADGEAYRAGIPTSQITTSHVLVANHEQNVALLTNEKYSLAVEKFNKAFEAALVAGDAHPTIEKTQNFMRGAIEALLDEKNSLTFARHDDNIVTNNNNLKNFSKGFFSPKDVTPIKLPEAKFNMVVGSFVNSVYENEIKRFAKQDVANITLDSIAAEVEHLKQLFPNNHQQKIIKDLCAALMANSLFAQTANELISPETIATAVAERRTGLEAQKLALLTRLAQLYKAEHGERNPIFQNGTFTFEGQIDQAWKAWHGYEAIGRASENPGKVIITRDGEEVEVDGKTGTNAWGSPIAADKVWVAGTEQVALTKLIAFLQLRNGVAVTGSLSLNDVNVLASLLNDDVSNIGPALQEAKAAAMNAVSANAAAQQNYEELNAERAAKEREVAEINRELSDEMAFTASITDANSNRADFLNIFVPRQRHGLNAAAGQLTSLLQRRARELAAVGQA